MDSDKVQQLNSAIEAKLSEILPNIDQLVQEYSILEPIEVKFKIDLSKWQSGNSQSDNIQAEPITPTGSTCYWNGTNWSCTAMPSDC